MKTELTLENKAKFFAQYWGQLVIEDVNGKGETFLYPVVYSNMHRFEESTVVLKPLSSISDEDLEYIRTIVGYINTESGLGLVKRWLTVLWMNYDDVNYFAAIDFKPTLSVIKITDYLRSKGYALPWIGISVEEMVDAGWIKLQSE